MHVNRRSQTDFSQFQQSFRLNSAFMHGYFDRSLALRISCMHYVWQIGNETASSARAECALFLQARFAIKPGEMGNGKKRARCVRYDNLMSGNMSYNM